MTKFPHLLAATVLLLGATAAAAQMTPATPKATATAAAKAKVAKKTTTAKVAPAATMVPAAKSAPVAAAPAPKQTPKPRAKAAPAPTGRMVQAKLSNGKTVTYNCSLAGNKTKKACQ